MNKLDATKKNTNNRKIWIMFIILAALAIFVMCGGFLFRVYKVDFEIISSPNFQLSADEIEGQIIQKYSKQSILYFSVHDAKKEIESQFKYAKVQKIKKEFPGTVVIRVYERYEIFAVQSGDQFRVLDVDLFEIKKTDSINSNRGGTLVNVKNYSDKSAADLKQIVKILIECQKINLLNVCDILDYIEFDGNNCEIGFKSGKSCTLETGENFAVSLKTVFDKEENIW